MQEQSTPLSAFEIQSMGEGLWTSAVQCKSYLKANEGLLCAMLAQWMSTQNHQRDTTKKKNRGGGGGVSHNNNYRQISEAAMLTSSLAAMISLQPIEVDLVPTLRPMFSLADGSSRLGDHQSAFCFDLCEVPNSFLMPLVPSLEEVFCGDRSHCDACVQVRKAREVRRGSLETSINKATHHNVAITQEQEEQSLTLALAAGLLGNLPFLVRLLEGQPELTLDMAAHAMTGACREGHPHIVRYLAQHRVYGGPGLGPLLEERDIQGFNCVHYAAMLGSLPMMRELLVTCRVPGALRAGQDGATPLRSALEYAVAAEAFECVELMLSYPLGEQFTDLDWAGALAVRNGESSLRSFHLLRNHNQGDGLTTTTREFLLILAAACGNTAVIKNLVQAGETLNINIGEPGTRMTPLSYGCLNGHPDIVEHLLDFKCLADRMDKQGNIGFHHAAANGNTWTVGHLLKAKSDWKVSNKKGQTAKQVADLCKNDIISMTLSVKR